MNRESRASLASFHQLISQIYTDGQELVSAITRTSAEALKLKQGDHILAVIKSTEVMLGRE